MPDEKWIRLLPKEKTCNHKNGINKNGLNIGTGFCCKCSAHYHYNKALTDVKSALAGKILLVEDVPSVDAIKDLIHLNTWQHRDQEDAGRGVNYKKDCHYCNDRPWLKSIAQSIHSLILTKAVRE